MTAAEILHELVAIPTPSAVSNLPLIKWVREFAEGRGWRVKLFPYSDENAVAKANLIARPVDANSDERIELAFVCHTDTVPFASAWSEALELRERDGRLHGCGACDVKGALACFLAAIDGAAESEIDAGAGLVLTADEEIGCKGMDRLLAAGDLRIGAAIVSEPTSLRAGVAGKGYGLARVTVEGAEAHSAFPGEGLSAIRIAAQMVERAYELGPQSNSGDSLFDPPWRPVPNDPPKRMLGEVERLAEEARAAYPGSRVAVEALRAEAGFAAVAGGRLRDRLWEISAPALTGISFGSEASRVARIADEVIVMGPGDMHTAHSERECVPMRELEEWTAILGKLLRRV